MIPQAAGSQNIYNPLGIAWNHYRNTTLLHECQKAVKMLAYCPESVRTTSE